MTTVSILPGKQYVFIFWNDLWIYLCFIILVILLIKYRYVMKAQSVEAIVSEKDIIITEPEEKIIKQRELSKREIRKKLREPIISQNTIHTSIYNAPGTIRLIYITYVNFKGKYSERIVDPNKIYFRNDIYYMEGLCYLRDESRTFRVDRIRGIEVLEGMEREDLLDHA